MKIANMKLHTLLLALIGVYACSADYDPASYVDRPCGTDLSNLWLDVIAVVDNSRGMTNKGLSYVASSIISVFGKNTRIGSSSSEPRTTRIGLVTYNSVATQMADLNQYQSIKDMYSGIYGALSTTVNTTESYLTTGLNAAVELFSRQSFRSNRQHYRKVIIVYASEYNGRGEFDPVPIANRLKASGVNIITIAYEQPGSVGLLKGLSQIASPGFSFSGDNIAGNLVKEIQTALLQSNCFCPIDWTQYRGSYPDPTSYRYGVCLLPVNLPKVWASAKMACSMIGNHTHLATEFDQSKHDFIFNLAQHSNFKQNPYTYHIGLNFVNGAWIWDQPAGQSPVNLKSWSNWQTGFPIGSPASQSVVRNIQNGVTTKWNNIAMYTAAADYVCETYSCDTDNYCDADFVYDN